MAFCTLCGDELRWFQTAHFRCVRSAAKGADQVASIVVSTIIKLNVAGEHTDDERSLAAFATQAWSEPKEKIEKLVLRHRIPSDALRAALIRGWSAGTEQLAGAEPMPVSSFNVMKQLLAEMGLSDLDVKETQGFKTCASSLKLWRHLREIRL